MDAITLLKKDHQAVEQLFKQFEKLTDRAQKSKKALVMKMIRELAVHAAVEEMLFYPAVRMAALRAGTRAGEKLAGTVLESLEEHHIVKWLLTELQGMKPDDERFEAKVKVLSENVRHHVEEEQEEMFPRVQKLMDMELLGELGERMARAKKLAPTRPHPRAPDTPPGNYVAGAMAAMMDKSRDVLRDLFSRRSSATTSS